MRHAELPVYCFHELYYPLLKYSLCLMSVGMQYRASYTAFHPEFASWDLSVVRANG